MSKWFRGGSNLEGDSDDDSEEQEEQEEQEESDEEDEEEEQEQEKKEEVSARSKWLKASTGDGKDDGDKARDGAVLSHKAKQEKDLLKNVGLLKNSFKNTDFSKMVEAFEALTNQVSKIQGPLGGDPNQLPKPMVKCIIAVENFLARTADSAKVKELSKPQHKSCQTLKHKVKKVHKFNETQVDAFKEKWDHEDPDVSDEEEDDEDEEEEEPEAEKAINLADTKDWTSEAIRKKIDEILATRGKKSTDKLAHVDAYKKILLHVRDNDLRIEVLILLISSWFDTVSNLMNHMPQNSWKSAYDCLSKVLNILADSPTLVLDEADVALNEQPAPMEGETKKVPIKANLTTFVERLDDEYTKSLQFIDPHTQEYITRFQDEAFLMDAMERVYHYYTIHNMPKHAARVAQRLIEHLYYRRQEDHVQMLAKQRNMCEKSKQKKAKEEKEAAEKLAEEEGEPVTPATEPETPQQTQPANLKRRREYTITDDLHDTVSKYMTLVLKHGDEKARVKALLCNMYRLALHNNFAQARDLLLMSRYSDQMVIINNSAFQILYNRVLAQLGLAAFRQGSFKDVNLCLNELCATQKLRELLAQGTQTQRYPEKKPEQEKQDKMKLCPFHMHINLDLLEAVHLVSALLLEVPLMVANPYDKRRISSKAFSKMLTVYQHQVFLGPPESNIRDHVYAAKLALEVGDWEKCCGYIVDLPVWSFLPQSDDIRKMLSQRIKEESLRCYLFRYSQFYDTLSLESLAKQFALSSNKIHSVVSKMIFNDELSGSWDQPAACIRIQHTHPTKLQYLISRTVDKSQQLLDTNERILGSGTAGFGANLAAGKGYPQQGQARDWGWGNSGGDGGRFSGLGAVRKTGIGFGTRNFGGGSQSWFTKGNNNRFGSNLGGQRKGTTTRFR